MGKKTGPNPTDRAKGGTQRSVLVEASGLALAVEVAGASRHDSKLAEATLMGMMRLNPLPKNDAPQGLCLDKAYDSAPMRALVASLCLTAHIRSRGEEAHAVRRKRGQRARRWVVERTHSWMNRFRRILVRWEKRADTYLAMLHLTCGLITWRATGLLE